jgi:hypothetical protein
MGMESSFRVVQTVMARKFLEQVQQIDELLV